MLDEINIPQMNRWMAYARIEPFGAPADWHRHGDLMSLICNIVSPKGSVPAKITDFIPE